MPTLGTEEASVVFWNACRQGDLELAKKVRHEALANCEIEDLTPLQVATEQGAKEVVRYLLADPAVNINHQAGDTGNTGLAIACLCGHLELVDLYLMKGVLVDVRVPNFELDTPLLMAARSGNAAILSRFLRDTRVDQNQRDREGRSILHIAVEASDLELVQLILQEGQVDPNLLDGDGLTALLQCCENGSRELALAIARDPRTEIKFPTREGRTALFYAIHLGWLELVQELMAKEGELGIEQNFWGRGYHDIALEMEANEEQRGTTISDLVALYVADPHGTRVRMRSLLGK